MKLRFIAATLFLTVTLTCVQAQKVNNSLTTKKNIMTQVEKNKQTVATAYQRIFGDLDTIAVDDYMSKDFIQHNPTIADGPEGVKALVQMLISKGIPKQKIEFKHIIAEGDIVILHSRYEMAGKEWRFIDIYRVENSKIAEHWDAMMQMPDDRANNNPMF
jgi:predicted SnoaL-like aldol condensation-catalyzing enzyme